MIQSEKLTSASPQPLAADAEGARAPAESQPAGVVRLEDRQVIRVRAPLTGEALGQVPVMDARRVREVVARARAAQAAWAELSFAARGRKVLAFRDALVAHAEELVELMARESGKPRQEGILHEVAIVADLATHFALHAGKILAPHKRSSHFFPYTRSTVEYAPRGVVAVIGPWNFPLQLTMRDALAAVMAGNAAVVKPSEVTPLILQKTKEIWDSSGMPEDLLGVVTGYGPTGAALIDAGIDFVVFTGSVATGRKVAAACGERLIPCVMELGGKAPLIACADCDVERTAQAILVGGFANSGQVCISVERVYAHSDIYDELVDRVVELAGKLKIGNPAVDHVDIGAITFPHQIEVAERLIADAVSKGAELRCGGKRVEGQPASFEPTVLTGCDHGCKVMTEEIFGPIVPFMRVSSADEAIRLANDSHLGLNAYVFTEDPERGRSIASKLEAGSVMVNDTLVNAAMAEMPFGGIKQSGFGRVLGEEGLRDMCNVKHVCVERFKMPRRHPLAFPYTERTYGVLLGALRALYQKGGALERLRRLL